MTASKTLIVILHFGSTDDTLDCIDSLQQVDQCDIMVVNNDASTSIVGLLERRFPQVICRQAGPETGFSAANNLGLRYSLEQGYAYSLLLNNDTIAEDNFLLPLREILDSNPEVAMVGPAMYYYRDKARLWSCGGWINRYSAGMAGYTDLARFNGRWADVDYLPGACILVRNGSLKAFGLMSENYFLGIEEADWAFEARRAHLRVVACAASRLLHKVGISSELSPKMTYNEFRNRFMFLSRQSPPLLGSLLIFALFLSGIVKRPLSRKIQMRALVDHFRYETITRRHLDCAVAVN